MYTAAVLRDTSAHLLRWITKALTTLEGDGFAFRTPQSESIPHHMTVNLGTFDDRINPNVPLGSYVEIRLSKLVFNYTLGVCAAPVTARVEIAEGEWTKLHTINDHPHITIALKPGVPARMSNDLLAQERTSPHVEIIELDQTYTLEADLEEVRPTKSYMGA